MRSRRQSAQIQPCRVSRLTRWWDVGQAQLYRNAFGVCGALSALLLPSKPTLTQTSDRLQAPSCGERRATCSYVQLCTVMYHHLHATKSYHTVLLRFSGLEGNVITSCRLQSHLAGGGVWNERADKEYEESAGDREVRRNPLNRSRARGFDASRRGLLARLPSQTPPSCVRARRPSTCASDDLIWPRPFGESR